MTPAPALDLTTSLRGDFSCPHPHFPPISPPFSPIFPHFPPFFLGHVTQYTPPQPPRAREKWFFGVLAHRYPHFSTKNLQILTVGPILPHFSNLEQFSGGITRSLPAAGN